MQIWIPHHPFSWPICFCFPWTLKHSSKSMGSCIHQRPGGDRSDPIQYWPYSHYKQGAGPDPLSTNIFFFLVAWFCGSEADFHTKKYANPHPPSPTPISMLHSINDQSQQQGNMHSLVSQNGTLSLTTSKSLWADKLPT